ncbi:hypothetical protein [Undibacterium sp. WLHG33]|uniref:hypothetical protein n=1 Tax=Undibacterium sp. WLHG33 TaxID=3412482 RepID=UPI003C2D5918
MQSFKNLAEGTFDEAFAKIVHTKLYQIRLLRHNQFDQGRVEYFLFPGGRGQVAALVVWRVIFLGWHSKALFKDLRGVPMGLSPALPRIRAFLEPKPAARIDLRQ